MGVPGVWGCGGVVHTLGGTRGTGPGPPETTVLPCFGCFATVWLGFSHILAVLPCLAGF